MVQISNISKTKKKHKNIQKNDFYILIASFYSKDVADFLKQRTKKKYPNLIPLD